VAKNFIKDRIVTDTEDVSEIKPGEGKIVRIDGESMAVSRDENYDLHAVSPVCTHLKCYVHWNKSEKTWDCPCHGSRFSSQGEVLYGPAVKALAKKEIKAKTEQVNSKKE
jgi:Rieske Fe-S protein